MIPIKEARTILKGYGENLKDDDLQAVISFLSRLADKIIDNELCKPIALECSKPII